MDPSPDELAGAVDGFGGLTREELRTALEDLAARAGDGDTDVAIDDAIDDALERYYLLELPPSDAMDSPEQAEPATPLLLPGPAALPRLPEGGEDLPHLLDVEPRAIDRHAVATAVETQLRADAAAAIDAENDGRADQLLDVCYAVEAWASVDLDDAKTALAALVD